jgi:diguanylate cyclase (GGDEF)-like protein
LTVYSELLLVLAFSVLGQTLAAWVALHQMISVSGRYRLAWGCVSLALALMVQRRAAPLWRLVVDGQASNVPDAWFGLAISVLMALGILGIRQLFVDMQHQEAQLDALARTDVLTGLPNRREILECLQAELERSARSGHPVSVLMLDVDHFKQVNDTYGHAAGDHVLQALAGAAHDSLRRIDSCGRIGGEEFLVLLPETDIDEASATAERLRLAIAEAKIIAEQHALQVTVSIGVATHRPADPMPTPELLLQRADRGLYAAKKGGRNRVVSA